MRFARVTWLGIFAVGCAAAALIDCVGDDPASPTDTGGTDAGGDSPSQQNDGSPPGDAKAPADSGTDSGPGCVAPTSATPGALDQTFGSSFKAVTNGFLPFAATTDLAGREYVVGQAFNCAGLTTSYDYAIVRLTPDGAVDLGFNPANKPICFSFDNTQGGGEAAQAVGVEYVTGADGGIQEKVVIGGFGGYGNVSSGHYVAGVVRINENGSLDTTFNGSGMLAGIYPGGLAYDTNGGRFVSVNAIGFYGNKIVLAGSDGPNPIGRTTGFISRLNDDGSIDSGFAKGTANLYTDGNVGGFSSVAVSSAGTVTAAAGPGAQIQVNFVVEQLTSAGALNSGFGTAGVYAPAALDGAGYDIAATITEMPNGNFAVAGAVNCGNTFTGTPAILMISPTGAPVPTFGTNGLYVAPVSLKYETTSLFTPLVHLCGDDFFLVARQDQADGGPIHDVGIQHILKNGTADTAFGAAGLGLGGQSISNVVGVAMDPVAQKPLVTVLSPSVPYEVGIFRFDP